MTIDCLRMFLHHPIAASGLGTFPTVYPRDRTFFTTLFVNQPHNDYAQLLVETGLLGFWVMVWFLVRLYRRATQLLDVGNSNGKQHYLLLLC